MSDSIDSLGKAGAELMMRGAVQFIRSRGAAPTAQQLEAVVGALRAQGPKAVEEVIALSRVVVGSPIVGSGLVDAAVSAIFVSHGIEAAKAVFS